MIDDSRENERQIALLVPHEFSFAENLSYLSRAVGECMFRVHEQRVYKALSVERETPIIEIRSDDDSTLLIRFLGNTAHESQSVIDAVVRYVKEWFDLDTDLRPFYELARTDLLLNRAVRQCYGLRHIGIPDLFEAICWGILGQQINLSFAYTLKRRFVERFGQGVSCENEQYWLFPEPEKIASLSVQELTPLQITTKKSEYLIGTAEKIAEGKLTKELLLQANDIDDAEKLLLSIRGIGPWTAHYVLMRCLRYPNAFPIDDVGLQNAIRHLLDQDKKPTREEIRKLSANWAGWEAYATFYLWRLLY